MHVRKIDSYNLRMQERERSVSPSFSVNERVMARIRADESAPLGNLAVVDDDGTNAHKRASADGRDRERHRRAVAKRTQVPPASATAVTHAHTVRIGPAHECGIFEADGFVYATILGEGVPSRSRPVNKHTHIHVSNNDVLGVEDHGLEGVGLPSAACQRSPRSHCEQTSTVSNTARGHVSADVGAGGCAPNYRMVSRDQHKPPLAHFMHALCDNDMTVSDEAVGRGSSRSRLTLGQIFSSVLRTGDKGSLSTCRHKATPTVYKITSPIGKAYVGQTVWPGVRMSKHKHGKSSKCPALVAAVRKYGWSNMQVEVLRGGPGAVGGEVAEEELDSLEEGFIASIGTLAPHGYNIQKGGKVAWRGVPGLSRHGKRQPRSEETKQLLRNVWEDKREMRLADMDTEMARRARRTAEKQAQSRREKQAGAFVDGRFGENQRRRDTWEAKREAKLATLPPEVAAKERDRMARKREGARKRKREQA